MNTKQLKEITELMSVGGLIDSFVLQTDGTVRAIDDTATLIVELKYKGINLEEDIGIGKLDKIKDATSVLKEGKIAIVNNELVISETKFRDSKIPLVSIEAINTVPDVTFENFTTTIKDVELETIKKVLKMKFTALEDEFLFYTEDSNLILEFGSRGLGTSRETLGVVTESNVDNEHLFFDTNIKEILSTLKSKATFALKTDKLLYVSVETENYNVGYAIAPRVES